MKTPNRKRAIAYWIACIVLVALFGTSLWFGYVEQVSWIGFSEYRNLKSVVTNGKTIDSFEVQRAKTLWDWLQLLVIPTVLAIGGFLLNERVKEREASAAIDGQREAALQKYFDAVSDLLIKQSSPEIAAVTAKDGKNEAITDAHDIEMSPLTLSLVRARTLSTLIMLDPDRKGSLIRFLLDAHLIQHYQNRRSDALDLMGADLRDANLTHLSLSRVRLFNVDLRGADLRWCNLKDAQIDESGKMDQKWRLVWGLMNRYYQRGYDLRNVDLRDAHLGGAMLSGADLRGANLSGAILDLTSLFRTKINWRTRLDPKWRLVWKLVNRRDLKANLEGVDLSFATLSPANLSDKSFVGATLVWADLSFTRLLRANFDSAGAISAKFHKSAMTEPFPYQSELSI
jgi:uncharacterized protein YjbI with pentapeptide repeats